MMTSNFTCSFCGQKKEYDQLAGELKKPSAELVKEKEQLEKELVKTSSLQISTTDQETKADLVRKETRILQELGELARIIKNKKENVCSTCWKKFAKGGEEVFDCPTCGKTIKGNKNGCHVSNFEKEGISWRKWIEVCNNCYFNKVELANIYCPWLNKGRVGDWDINKPLFDCSCPVVKNNEKKHNQ